MLPRQRGLDRAADVRALHWFRAIVGAVSTGDTPRPSRGPTAPKARARGFGAIAIAVALGAAAGPEGAARASAVRFPLAVRVAADGCTAVTTLGAGVALGGTRVATVAHVVAGAADVRVTTADGRRLAATIVAVDTEHDVALLDVAGLAERPTPQAELAVGERGTYVGYTGGQAAPVGFTVTTAASIVSEDIYVKGRHARPGYVLRAAVVHGDSGAGLVRTDGTLGGLVWAASRNTDREGWGVGVDALAPLVAATPPDAAPAAPVPCPPL